MFVVAVTRDLVVAALKLDVAKDPGLGKVGFIKHFEIEDALESTVLGNRMLEKTTEIAEKKGLRALDAIFDISRTDLIDLYTASEFKEERKEVVLRKDFGPSIF